MFLPDKISALTAVLRLMLNALSLNCRAECDPRKTNMKSLLLSLLSVFSFVCYAQTSDLRVEPANVVKEVVVENLDKTYQDITTITVTNESLRTMQLVREQVIIGKPSVWRYGIFNRRTRNAPYQLSNSSPDAGDPILLSPGESMVFHVVLQPEGLAGDGRVEVRFTDLTVPGRLIGKAVIASEIVHRTSVSPAPNSGGGAENSRPVPTTVRIYPNPARENFFVESPPGTRVGRIEISNALGNRLRKFNRPSGKEGYNVSDLPDGLYLISIYDKQGKKLKTLRLLHRQFGA